MNPPTFENSKFHEKFESRYHKVTKYAANEYKFTLDDSLRDILAEDYGLKISYSLTDLKLFLGFLISACGISGALYAHFYKDQNLHVLAFVLSYFFLSLVLSYISHFIENDRVVLAHKDSLTVQFSTRFEPLQKLSYKVELHASRGSRKIKAQHAVNIAKLFTESGQLVGQEWYRIIMGWMQKAQKELGNE